MAWHVQQTVMPVSTLGRVTTTRVTEDLASEQRYDPWPMCSEHDPLPIIGISADPLLVTDHNMHTLAGHTTFRSRGAVVVVINCSRIMLMSKVPMQFQTPLLEQYVKHKPYILHVTAAVCFSRQPPQQRASCPRQ